MSKPYKGFFPGLGFSKDLKDELAARDETSSLAEQISLAISLDNRLRKRGKERTSRQGSHIPHFRPSCLSAPQTPVLEAAHCPCLAHSLQLQFAVANAVGRIKTHP